MKYQVKFTTTYKKSYKLMMKRKLNLALLKEVVMKLANGEKLPSYNKDHALAGNFSTFRECHIKPDWLLIYKIEENILTLTLIVTGSHSDLFDI